MYIHFLAMCPYVCSGALKTRINCSLCIKRKKKKVTKPPCGNKRKGARVMTLTSL